MARVKSSKKVIEVLNNVYTAEIGAVGIYMDQHIKAADAGYKKFADMLKKDAVEEMKHAEHLAERILYLGVDVRYDKHEVPKMPETDPVDFFKTDIQLETVAIKRLNDGIDICFKAKDNGSRILLETILKEEETHLDVYETMLENITRYGDAYIVQHLM